MLFICLFSHGAFLVTFGVLGVRSLALLNVGSVLIYLVSILLLRRGAVQAAYALGVTEVATHSVAATLVLGWDSGFHYYIPVLAFLCSCTHTAGCAPADGSPWCSGTRGWRS